MLRLSAHAFLLLALAAGPPAIASVVVVPDDVPTVQAGIDSGADTVLVRDGIYDERPVTIRSVVLSGIGPGRPHLSGLAFFNHGSPVETPRWLVHQIAFSGPIEITTNSVRPRGAEISFNACALDSGIRHLSSGDPYDIASLSIRNGTIGGYSHARISSVHMEADTIDGGVAWDAQDAASILECWFRGGVGSAIEIEGDDVAGVFRISSNTIAGYETGILTGDDDVTVIESNIVSDCGTGIHLPFAYDIAVRNNIVTDCGVGIAATADIMQVLGNTVLRASGNGIRLRGPDRNSSVRGNVVGSCGGPGILVLTPFDDIHVTGNSVFDNAGSGIEVYSTFGGSVIVRNNISAFNRGWGIRAHSGAAVDLGCNDLFDNVSGAVDGAMLESSDVSVDPRFCNLDSADVRLMADSPLLDAPGCGLIGALGVGCGATPVLVALFRAEPAEEGVRIEWQWGGTECPSDFWIERASDAAGPWERIAIERLSYGGITVDLDRSVEAGVVYFYRLAWVMEDGDRSASAAVSATALGAASFAMKPISPNPSNGRVEIAWSLPRAGLVELVIFDIAGREVARLASGHVAAGNHMSTWNGLSPPGVYLVRLRHDGRESTQRVHLRR